MNLCLDTNVAIELMRARKPHFRQRLIEAQQARAELHLSTISLHELAYGARSSNRPANQTALVEQLTAHLNVTDWSGDDAIEAARVRAELKLRGLPIGNLDALIAGQARHRGWTVVTANVTEFARVEGLGVIDWSDPAGPIDATASHARLPRPSQD